MTRTYSYNFIAIIFISAIVLKILNKTIAAEPPEFNKTSTNTMPQRPRSLLAHSDEYVARNQKQCVESRSLVSCIKYKASKIIWKLATNSMGYFPNEYGRELREDKRRIRFIQLGQPADEIIVFNNARSLEGLFK